MMNYPGSNPAGAYNFYLGEMRCEHTKPGLNGSRQALGFLLLYQFFRSNLSETRHSLTATIKRDVYIDKGPSFDKPHN
jgi:hypothetical protein